MFTFGSLFAGIGGMDLGLERAGMACAWQVEIDDYASGILARRWPSVPRFRDVRECGVHNLAPVDLVAGGFPCQDISKAGKGAGIEGERSGLWSEFFRIICELRPRYVVVENVANLLSNGVGRVLGDLASIGFDAEWEVLPAGAFGTPHFRARVFLVAYPEQAGAGLEVFNGGGQEGAVSASPQPALVRLNHWQSSSKRLGAGSLLSEWATVQRCEVPEPFICDLVDGLPAGLAEVGGLGNAVVPEVAEWIGRRILDVAQTSES